MPTRPSTEGRRQLVLETATADGQSGHRLVLQRILHSIGASAEALSDFHTLQTLRLAIAHPHEDPELSEGNKDEEMEEDAWLAADAAAPEPSTSQAGFEAPQPTCWLSPSGQVFTGFQRYTVTNQQRRQDDWDVSLRVHSCDWERGVASGVMEAGNTPRARSSVVTYWEAEVVDGVNFTFYTDKWGTSRASDLDHWTRFSSFTPRMGAEVRQLGGRCRGLAQHSHVYLRLKELEFVNSSPDTCGLSISGLYYLCLDRQTGGIQGFYHDPHSTSYQYLELTPKAEAGMTFGSYEFA